VEVKILSDEDILKQKLEEKDKDIIVNHATESLFFKMLFTE